MDSDFYFSQKMSLDWDGEYSTIDQESWDSVTPAASPSDDRRFSGIVLCDASPDIILPSSEDGNFDSEEETLVPSPSEEMDGKQSLDWDITHINVSGSDIESDFESDDCPPFMDLEDADGSCLGTNSPEAGDDGGIVCKIETDDDDDVCKIESDDDDNVCKIESDDGIMWKFESDNESESEIQEVGCSHSPESARRNLNFGAPIIKSQESDQDDDFQGYMCLPEEDSTERESTPEIEELPEIESAHHAQDSASNNAYNLQDLACYNAGLFQRADISQDPARRWESSSRTPSTTKSFKFVNKADKERSPSSNSFFEVKIAFFGTRGKSFLKVLNHHQGSPTKRLGEDYQFLGKNFTPLQELKKQEKYRLKKVVNCLTKNSYSRFNYMELACMLNLSDYDLRLTKLVQSTIMEIFSELFVDFKVGSHRWNRDIDRDRRKFMINLLHKYTSIWYPEIDLQVLDILIRRASYSGMQRVSRSARRGPKNRSF